MSLNTDQENSARAVLQFLLNDEKEFRIAGPAGVGKTFLLQHIEDVVLQDYYKSCSLLGIEYKPFSIAFTATTNKAVEALQKNLNKYCETIHSFMNLKVYDEWDTGKQKISKTNNWKVYSNFLIFIDEASMIDSNLMSLLHEGTDKTCKIIYVGDQSQLTPVKEKDCPAFVNGKNITYLTTPVRNVGQPTLMNLCSELRNLVETKKFNSIDIEPGVVDYLDPEQAQKFIETEFKEEDPNKKILAYTNNRVQDYNRFIRCSLRGYPEEFIEGEELVVNSAGVFSGTHFPAETVVQVTESIHKEKKTKIYDDANTGEKIELKFYVLHLTKGSSHAVVYVPVDEKHRKELTKYFGKTKQWDNYWHLKNQFPDLRAKIASTIYKAQGSTYDTVFIDLDDIGNCKRNNQIARLLYVAASRARNRVVFYGSLPERVIF